MVDARDLATGWAVYVGSSRVRFASLHMPAAEKFRGAEVGMASRA